MSDTLREQGGEFGMRELPIQPLPNLNDTYAAVAQALLTGVHLEDHSSLNSQLYTVWRKIPAGIMDIHRLTLGKLSDAQLRRNQMYLEQGVSIPQFPQSTAADVIQQAVTLPDYESPTPFEVPASTPPEKAVGAIRRFFNKVRNFVTLGRDSTDPVPQNLSAYGWESKLAGEDDLKMNYGEKFADDISCKTAEKRAAKLIAATTDLYVKLSNPETAEATALELNEKEKMMPNRFRQIFGVRIPGKRADTRKINDSDYILLTGSSAHGDSWMYKLQVIRDGAPISPGELEATITLITQREKDSNTTSDVLRRRSSPKTRAKTSTYANLTRMSRRGLYKVTNVLKKDTTNNESLETYRNALLCVSIIDDDFHSYSDAIQYGTMGFRKDENNTITATSLHTPNDLGLTIVISKYGEAVVKAEHLIADGSAHELLVNAANERSLRLPYRPFDANVDTSSFQKVLWNIPEKLAQKAEADFIKEAKRNSAGFLEVSDAGANEFGKQWVDTYMQMAAQLAHAATRMQMFRDNGKKIDLGEILNFYAVEPVKMTHYHYGRLSIPQVKTTEMHDLMYVMLAQSNTENLDELTRKLVHASALSIQAEVKKAKEGKAFLSHLMTLTAANMMGNSEKAGAYMRIMESIFIRFHPQIKRLFKAELLASNGVRSDQVKGLRGFTTVRSLADDGITVGYIPGINGDPSRFFIRATGKFNDYTDYYAQQLERYLHILKRYRMQ